MLTSHSTMVCTCEYRTVHYQYHISASGIPVNNNSNNKNQSVSPSAENDKVCLDFFLVENECRLLVVLDLGDNPTQTGTIDLS